MRSAYLVVVAGLSGCGGTYQLRPLIDATAFVSTARDAAAIERMLDGSVTNGGLWFDDPACAAAFGTPGEIKRDGFAAFARCLAGLHLQASPRTDELADVVVLTYDPGFEIEARVVDDGGRPRLTWIGYESRRREDPLIPTVSVATLEAHRLAGDKNGPLDPVVAKTLDPGSAEATWLKVCVTATGDVTIEPRETTSVAAQHAFAEAASMWKFRPVVVRDRAIDVCAMVRLAYPPGQQQVAETLPLTMPLRSKGPAYSLGPSGPGRRVLEGQRIKGSAMIVPDDGIKMQIHELRVPRVVGKFRVCIDEAGHVEMILPLQSTRIPAYDRELYDGIRRWAYSPYLVDGRPTAVCTSVTFIYSQS